MIACNSLAALTADVQLAGVPQVGSLAIIFRDFVSFSLVYSLMQICEDSLSQYVKYLQFSIWRSFVTYVQKRIGGGLMIN